MTFIREYPEITQKGTEEASGTCRNMHVILRWLTFLAQKCWNGSQIKAFNTAVQNILDLIYLYTIYDLYCWAKKSIRIYKHDLRHQELLDVGATFYPIFNQSDIRIKKSYYNWVFDIIRVSFRYRSPQ